MSRLAPMIRACAACGKENRIPVRHLADRGRCGACKAELAPLSEPIDVDARSFDEIIAGARVPVLVDFWAAWCGPCRMVAPEVKKVASQMAGKAIVLKVDTDANQQVAARFNVRGIPNFAVFRQGKLVAQQAGAVSHTALARLLERAA